MNKEMLFRLIEEPITYLYNAKDIINENKVELKNYNDLFEKIISNKDKLIAYSKELEDYISYIEAQKRISVFNNDFEHKMTNICVNREGKRGLKYVSTEAGNIYYPKWSRTEWIQQYHRSIEVEQDPESPHRYFDDNEKFTNPVVIDLGSAEGNFSLKIADCAKHIFLVEADKKWIEPLTHTFRKWKNKTTIINRFISDSTRNKSVSLRCMLNKYLSLGLISKDDYLLIKMDIEGFEEDVIKDSIDILSEFKNVELAICVYHHNASEIDITNMLKPQYDLYVNDGYMLFFYDENIAFPYFRHGVLRAKKRISNEQQ